MDKLRAAVARATERVARGQPDEAHGQGLAEYALILGLIAIVAIASLIFMGETISEMFWDPISEDFAAVLSRLGI